MTAWLSKQAVMPLIAKALLGSIVILILINYLMRAPYLIKNSIYEVFRYLNTRYVIHQMADTLTTSHNGVTIFFQDEDNDMVPIVAAVAEEFFEQVDEIFHLNGAAKTTLRIHPDKESLNKSFGWEADESAMGVYWAGVIRVLSPKAWIDGEDREVMAEIYRHGGPVVHEYIHYVIDLKTKGNYTRWLTEALAQYWERELTGFQFEMQEGKLDQNLYSFAMMDRQFDNLPNQALAYSQSLAAAEYMYAHHSKKQVDELLDALGAGLSLNQAMEKAFGYKMADFEKGFIKWVKENYQPFLISSKVS